MTRFAFLKGEASQRRSLWIGGAFLLFLTLCMFGDVLFTSRPIVLSDGQADLASQFIYWRAFSADQLRHGHVPLWNPHAFCGAPFLGWGQAGVFYPPNWLDLVLPLRVSINFGIALHVFLAGWFTFWWALRRGLQFVAAVVAGTLFMFSGAYFLHVDAGHLSLLCAIAWTPLALGAVDAWIQTRAAGWIVWGMGAVTMQILAGDMQACFYTAVAAGLLLAFDLVRAQRRWNALLGFLMMYAGAAALGAVQLLTSFQATSESVRANGVSYAFASMLSFAPENFLTLLAPWFFGNSMTGGHLVSTSYWGRWYLWEMCLFIGVSGLALAVFGAICGRRETRQGLSFLAVVLLVFALGEHTPVFWLLYHCVPGFNRFRCNAKFIIEASLFMAMLAGIGLDCLFQSPRRSKWLALGLVVASLLVGGTAFGVKTAARRSEQATTCWSRVMLDVYHTQESYLPAKTYKEPAFVKRAGDFASKWLFVAASEFLILGVLVLVAGVSRRAIYAVALMAIVEVFLFARSSLTTFDLSATEAPKLKAFLGQHPGDYRIFYGRTPNIAMWMGKEDVWGYAPLVLKRYAEFMAFTEGQSVEEATQYLEFSQFHRLHAMLRWQYAFLPAVEGDRILTAPTVMPRFQSISEYHVIKDRDEILRAMASPFFDPQQQVILETQPHPAPVSPAKGGMVEVLDSSANQMTITVDVSQPTILLITDAYSAGWRARPLSGSVQRTYQVLPANYVLQAIPLSQGHHHIRLEYLPLAFQVGAWISVVSAIGFILVVGYCVRSHRSRWVFP